MGARVSCQAHMGEDLDDALWTEVGQRLEEDLWEQIPYNINEDPLKLLRFTFWDQFRWSTEQIQEQLEEQLQEDLV